MQGGCAVALLHGVHAALGASEEATRDTLDFLLAGVVFVDWLFFACCGVALVRLAREPGAVLLWRGSVPVAWTFTALAAAVMVGAIATRPAPSAVGAALCAAGVLAYAAFCRRERG